MSRDVYVVRNGNDFDAMPVSVARIYRGFQGLHVINLASGEEKTYPPAAKVIRETVEFVNVPHTGLPMFLMGHCSEVMTLVERPPTKDLVPYTGSPSLSGGGSGGDQGTITSSSANCEAGGAELGVTFTVPDRYPGNVTVTLCSTGNPCYYFENIEPGSTHSVSIYSPGARSVYGVSMGIVFNGFTTPGVGGATIPGCSSD